MNADSAEEALDDSNLQAHQSKAAFKCAFWHRQHTYQRRGVYTTYAKPSTR